MGPSAQPRRQQWLMVLFTVAVGIRGVFDSFWWLLFVPAGYVVVIGHNWVLNGLMVALRAAESEATDDERGA
jgi:hypothetical protein